MAIADKVELTRVHTTVEADTFFPEIDNTQWKLVFFEEQHQKMKNMPLILLFNLCKKVKGKR